MEAVTPPVSEPIIPTIQFGVNVEGKVKIADADMVSVLPQSDCEIA